MNQELLQIWQSRKFQIFIDVCRVIMMIVAVIILFIFIKEIEAVKLLAYDPCRICMVNTGCECLCSEFSEFIVVFNITEVPKLGLVLNNYFNF